MTTRKNKPKINSTKNKRKTKCGGGPEGEGRPKRAAAIKSINKVVKVIKKNLRIRDLTLEPNPKFTKNETKLLNEANIRLTSQSEITKLQNEPRFNSLIKIDDEDPKDKNAWLNINLNWITAFMGDEGVLKFIVPGVEITRSRPRTLLASDKARAFFNGNHWTGAKQSETTVFDPYNEYQINGTNQFCQTYTMMYLCDKLPIKFDPNNPDQIDPNYPADPADPADKNTPVTNISKYYYYTRCAIKFIIEVIKQYPFEGDTQDDINYYREYHMNRAKNCLKYSNLCLNAIELL